MKIFVFALISLILVSGCTQGNGSSSDLDGQDEQFQWLSEDTHYFDGKREQKLGLIEDEIAILFEVPMEEDEVRREILSINPDIEITEFTKEFALIKLPENTNAELIAKELDNRFNAIISPVFKYGKSLTGGLIIGFKEEINENLLSEFESKYNLERIKAFRSSPKSYLFKAPSAVDSLIIANQITESGEVNYAYPNFLIHMDLTE